MSNYPPPDQFREMPLAEKTRYLRQLLERQPDLGVDAPEVLADSATVSALLRLDPSTAGLLIQNKLTEYFADAAQRDIDAEYERWCGERS